MKKLISSSILLILMSFGTQMEDKTVTITFTVEEINLVYEGLGELKASRVDQLRMKILVEAQKQLADTVKKK